MRKDQMAELRDLSVEELHERVRAAREELFRGRVSQAVENEQQGMRKRVLRREIARYLTIINEKQSAESEKAEAQA